MTRDDIRITVGIGLAFSLFLIFILGFVASSSRDVLLVVLGYVLGLLTVYANDRLKMPSAPGGTRVHVRRDE